GTVPSRMSAPTVRRPNVPLTARDEADLVRLRSSPAHLEALSRLAPGFSPVEQTLSESLLLHSVLAAGFEAVRRSVEEAGYEEMGAQYAEQSAQRRRVARRRTPSWAQEP
ncbi:MAG: hypothetical protein ACKOW5_17100, partial [Actinomycetales bacterium]